MLRVFFHKSTCPTLSLHVIVSLASVCRDLPDFIERTYALVLLVVSARDMEDAILFSEEFSVKADDNRRAIFHAILGICL